MVDYKALVEFVVRELVTQPDQVSVSVTDRDGHQLVDIAVASDDMGRVIGRRGSTIGAIRQLVGVAAAKAGDAVDVDIIG